MADDAKKIERIVDVNNTKQGVGLSLSGGGFRATLFHLGVIRSLYESELLPQVTHISSVSGGSILAAHLVLNWDRYTGDQDSFESAAREIVAFTQKDVRGRVMRRWLCSLIALGIPRIIWPMRRADLLEAEYDSLYGKKFLSDMGMPIQVVEQSNARDGNSSTPQLFIFSTSMTNGQAATFGPSQFQIRDDEESHDPLDMDTLKVSFAVTASSAFPPAFPPVRVDANKLNISANDFLKRYHSKHHYLTDGGVFDNLGVHKLKWLEEEQNVTFEKIIVSDAQREFEGDFESSYRFIVGRATRSTDLLMNRVSWFESSSIDDFKGNPKCEVLLCQLKRRVGTNVPYSLNTREQFGVHNMRTDLDDFTDDEVNALIHHGYAVARLAANENSNFSPVEKKSDVTKLQRKDVWHPLPFHQENPLDLSGAAKRKGGFFKTTDVFSWILLLLFMGYASLVGGAFYYSAQLQAKDKFIFDTMRLTETLATLAAESDFQTQETQEALEKWNNLKAELRHSDTFLKDLLSPDKFGDRIDRAIGEWEKDQTGYNGKLRNACVELGKEVRTYLLNQKNSSYIDWLNNSRDSWFDQIKGDVLRIDDADRYEVIANVSRKNFMRMYLGKMCLVEGKTVAQAMAGFRFHLEGWEQEKNGPGIKEVKEDIRQARIELFRALDSEKKKHIMSVER